MVLKSDLGPCIVSTEVAYESIAKIGAKMCKFGHIKNISVEKVQRGSKDDASARVWFHTAQQAAAAANAVRAEFLHELGLYLWARAERPNEPETTKQKRSKEPTAQYHALQKMWDDHNAGVEAATHRELAAAQPVLCQ